MNNKKSLFPLWLRLIVSLALLVYLLLTIDLFQILQTLKTTRLDLLILLLFMSFGVRVFAAYRWFFLYRCTNSSVTLRDSIKISFVANFFGQFLPGAVGTEAVRVYSMAKSTSDLAGSFTSVLVERVFGLLSLIIMVFVGLYLATPQLPSTFANTAWIALVVLVFSTGTMLYTPSRTIIERCLPRPIVHRIESQLKKFYYCIDLYKQQPIQLLFSGALALLFQVFRVLLCFVAALALSQETPLQLFFVFIPIIVFITLLPISVGGLGVREASFVYFFQQYGSMEATAAFTVSILIYAADTIVNLFGAYLYVTTKR